MPGQTVWRVGYKPEPWAWTGWEWATDGRFHGRWDDRDGNFRTVYAGATLKAALIEVLAEFRPDPFVLGGLGDIDEDPTDASLHPAARAGTLDRTWLNARAASSAFLTGRFCVVTSADSIAALRPWFIAEALNLGLGDFDAAALKDGRVRILTRSIATHLYLSAEVDGVVFASRHGDDLQLWGVFERPGDPAVSPRIGAIEPHPLSSEDPSLVEAMTILTLTWLAH